MRHLDRSCSLSLVALLALGHLFLVADVAGCLVFLAAVCFVLLAAWLVVCSLTGLGLRWYGLVVCSLLGWSFGFRLLCLLPGVTYRCWQLVGFALFQELFASDFGLHVKLGRSDRNPGWAF